MNRDTELLSVRNSLKVSESGAEQLATERNRLRDAAWVARDNLEPGRELDALIAEKVMGFRVSTPTYAGEGLPLTKIAPRKMYWTESKGWSDIPPYSTKIEHAWTVIEKMMLAPRDTLYSFDYLMRKYPPLHIEGRFTAALSICLAALKAVEIA